MLCLTIIIKTKSTISKVTILIAYEQRNVTLYKMLLYMKCYLIYNEQSMHLPNKVQYKHSVERILHWGISPTNLIKQRSQESVVGGNNTITQ